MRSPSRGALASRWRGSLPLRAFTRAGAVVAAGSLIGLAWYHLDVQPGATAAKIAFESGHMITPPSDIDRLRRAVASSRVTVPVADAPDAGLLIYRPREATAPSPVVLWIHGGGYIAHSAADVGDYAVLLASRGYVVASLDYTLAPHARYPVQIRQANAALAFIQERIASFGGDPSRVFVAGDSAGAQMASQLAVVQTNPAFAAEIPLTPGMPAERLRGVVLDCGLYDMSTVGDTGFPGLRTFLWAYTGYRDWMKAPFIDELSTAEAATSAYPPTFITDGDDDHFAGQSEELARSLETLGVPTETLFFTKAGLGHEYQFDFLKPQAVVALNQTVAFLQRHSR